LDPDVFDETYFQVLAVESNLSPVGFEATNLNIPFYDCPLSLPKGVRRPFPLANSTVYNSTVKKGRL
jgi:hypothetical protein